MQLQCKITFEEFVLNTVSQNCLEAKKKLRQGLVHPMDHFQNSRRVIWSMALRSGETKQLRVTAETKLYGAGLSSVHNLQANKHSFEDQHIRVLDRQDRWFERRVKLAVYVKLEKPSLKWVETPFVSLQSLKPPPNTSLQEDVIENMASMSSFNFEWTCPTGGSNCLMGIIPVLFPTNLCNIFNQSFQSSNLDQIVIDLSLHREMVYSQWTSGVGSLSSEQSDQKQ